LAPRRRGCAASRATPAATTEDGPPLAERELAAFVKDVTGAEAGDKTLPTDLSKAIVQEVDCLKRCLDTH
jgi:hypothetical protein